MGIYTIKEIIFVVAMPHVKLKMVSSWILNPYLGHCTIAHLMWWLSSFHGFEYTMKREQITFSQCGGLYSLSVAMT